MKLPHAENAVVPPEKIVDYLLNEANPRARGKAAFFLSFGFTTTQPELLAAALLTHARTQSVASSRPAYDGINYAIEGTLRTPDGRNPIVLSIWFVGKAETFLAWSRLMAHNLRMLKEHDSVVLTSDIPEHGLKIGDLGVIVFCHGKNEAFEVEFMTLAGKTVAVVTLLHTQIRAVGIRDLPQARELSVA